MLIILPWVWLDQLIADGRSTRPSSLKRDQKELGVRHIYAVVFLWASNRSSESGPLNRSSFRRCRVVNRSSGSKIS